MEQTIEVIHGQDTSLLIPGIISNTPAYDALQTYLSEIHKDTQNTLLQVQPLDDGLAPIARFVLTGSVEAQEGGEWLRNFQSLAEASLGTHGRLNLILTSGNNSFHVPNMVSDLGKLIQHLNESFPEQRIVAGLETQEFIPGKTTPGSIIPWNLMLKMIDRLYKGSKQILPASSLKDLYYQIKEI